MASPPLDARKILDQFDRLRDQGELFYKPTTPVIVQDGNLKFEFRVVPSFTTKPQLAADGEQTKTAQSGHRPPPSDGSDIDHSDPAFFVAHVCNSGGRQTHKLILNKFCVFRPQYLLLTTDPKQRQTSVLDGDDLFAASQVLHELRDPREHYILFNCGPAGGSSRSHKHMQVLECPRPEEGARGLFDWPPGEDALGRLRDDGVTSGLLPLPYYAFYRLLPRQEPNPVKSLVQAYTESIAQCAKALGVTWSDVGGEQEDDRIPHNVILTCDILVVIPRGNRTTDGLNGHAVNAPGMLGIVWCGSEEQLELWRTVGPSNALQSLGVSTSRAIAF